jgi:hypothetical protein
MSVPGAGMAPQALSQEQMEAMLEEKVSMLYGSLWAREGPS